MKVALPTHDGLHLSAGPGQADSFLVVTILAGEVVSEELRRISMDNSKGKREVQLSLIGDCSAVMVSAGDKVFSGLIRKTGMGCIETGERLITNAIIRFLGHEYLKESDTCCCP